MISIFDYTNFREYLRDYYEDKKRTNIHFSYEHLAQKAKLSNRGFVFNLIRGRRILSKENSARLSKALGHSKKECRYFEAIVAFTQAKTEEQRTARLEEIQYLRKVKEIAALSIGRAHYEYLSRWYHSVIRSLVDMYPVGENFEEVGRRIYPPVGVIDVKRSIDLLNRLHLIEKRDDGTYRVTGKSLQADEDLAQIARHQFHLECTELAKQSVLHPCSPQHLISSLTLGISEKTYEKIYDETVRFKERIMELADGDDGADRVYQYQLMLFPVTTAPAAGRGTRS